MYYEFGIFLEKVKGKTSKVSTAKSLFVDKAKGGKASQREETEEEDAK